MKKSEWGNAVWYLLHTLSYKLKDEYSSETVVLFSHINSIFHNIVNKKIKKPEFSREALHEKYSRANTHKVISHFIQIMSSNMNNEKLMMNSFRRQNYMNSFVNYIKKNGYKFNP
jgi:hypothetical protein